MISLKTDFDKQICFIMNDINVILPFVTNNASFTVLHAFTFPQ